jgi:hypothetical protein
LATVPARTWLESCTCPGAEAARIRFGQEGFEFPNLDRLWAQGRQEQLSRRDAFEAARAQAAGKSRDEIEELYVAELRARGHEISSQEVLDANVAAVTGDYVPVTHVLGQAVVSSVKFFRAARRNR